MNIVIYNLLNKKYGQKKLDETYLNELYKTYNNGSKIFNYEINISKDNFFKIFNIIYDVLRFKIDDEIFKVVSDHYLKLLMADARDGHIVDFNWFIKHIWYLSIGTSIENYSKKYNDCILFIQQKLIKEFNVTENTKEKISRKVYTNFMVKL